MTDLISGIIIVVAITGYLALVLLSLSQIFRSTLGDSARVLWVIAILIAPFFGSLVWLPYGRQSSLT